MEKRQRFTAEFKREAVRLLKAADKPAAVLARELGIPRNRLYKWAQDMKGKGPQAFGASDRTKASDDELSRLQRENTRLKEGVEILNEVRLDPGAERIGLWTSPSYTPGLVILGRRAEHTQPSYRGLAT